jgi:hypothetical protein
VPSVRTSLARPSLVLVATALFLAPAAQAFGAPTCHGISLKGDLQAGSAYTQKIGAGLALRLTPQTFAKPAEGEAGGPDGWRITLEPAAAATDFIYPVNLPLRFNPWQDIGTSYGMTAENKLSSASAISYRFVVSETDYSRISALLQGALWPYSAPDPEHAEANYLAAIEALNTGLIRFRPRHYELSANGERIRRLAFTAEITAPLDFAFLPSLQATPAPCPPKGE